MGLTTTQFIDELARSLGNRTDISDERYVRWLNWAILDICGFHKKRFLPPLRFHELEETKIFNAQVDSGTASASTDNTITISGTTIEVTADYYVDWIIQVNGEYHLVTAYDGSVATIADTWDTNPSSGDSVTLHSRSFHIENDIGISPKQSLWLIERMEVASDGSEVEQKKWGDLVYTNLTSVGTPSYFARFGDYIFFDVPIEESTSFRLYIYKFPMMLDVTAPSAQSELPDTFDEVIVLGATQRGFEKLMEPERAQQAIEKYQLELYNHQTAYFQEDKYVEKAFKLRKS